MVNEEKFKNFAYDLGVLIKEKAKAAKLQKDISTDSDDSEYQIGYLMAYHEIVDLVKQQAEAFDISQQDVGMIDIEADSDLI